jgi:two-component system chemotaxis response regulator CheB
MRRDVVVVGASAGGVEALRELVAGLSATLPATVLVVLHIPPHGGSALPAILSRSGPLPARHPGDREALAPGVVLVAPPDHHLVIDDGTVRTTRGPHHNGHRPAVDVLFRSAARAARERVVGVVLSGVLDDGTAGLEAIKKRGGLCVVQDPDDAGYPNMPENALAHVAVDHVVPARDMGRLLDRLCTEEIEDPVAPPTYAHRRP